MLDEIGRMQEEIANKRLAVNRKTMKRKRQPTRINVDNSETFEVPNAIRSGQRRRKETLDVCHNIHGGDSDNVEHALDGMWVTMVNVATTTRLTNYLKKSKKVTKKAIPNLVKDHVKTFEKSTENKVRSLKVLYGKGMLSKEQYKSVRTNLTMTSKGNGKKQSLKFMPHVNLPKLLPYDTLIDFVKTIDIGNLKDINSEFCNDLEEDDKVSGVYRDLESFLKELAIMYIKIDKHLGEKSFFKHFGNEPYHFKVAVGADGAPFGKDDEVTSWLISFINVGEHIASESECFLIAGANCSESHVAMVRYAKKLVKDISLIESKVYSLPGIDFRVKFSFELVPSDMKWASTFSGELPNSAFYFSPFGDVNSDNKYTVNGSLGTEASCTWKPWDYNRRLEVAAKVEEKREKLERSQYADSTKRNKLLDHIRNQKSRQEYLPILGKLVDAIYAEPLHNANNAWQQLNVLILEHAIAKSNIPKSCTNPSELPDCQFISYLSALKQMNAKRLYKKVKKWFSQGQKGSLSYRFTGKETKIFCHKFQYLIDAIRRQEDTPTDNLRICEFAYVGVQLRDATSIFSRVSIDDDVLKELKLCCKRYFNACSIFLNNITPTIWTIGYAVPYHTELLFRKFGVGLGINTMQGREAKHVRISQYAKHATLTTRWRMIMRHDFVTCVWMRQQDPSCTKYKKCKDEYIPKEIEEPHICYCGFEKDPQLPSCSLCSSPLYQAIKRTAESKSGKLDPHIKNLLSTLS